MGGIYMHGAASSGDGYHEFEFRLLKVSRRRPQREVNDLYSCRDDIER